MVKISKSKRQLAQLLIEAGVTQFPEGASWAAQDKSHGARSKNVGFYRGLPVKPDAGGTSWSTSRHDYRGIVGAWIEPDVLIPDWHQTALSREEFDYIVAQTELDADGWIEWNGGGCPVGGNCEVSVRVRGEGGSARGKAKRWSWGHSGDGSDIIAYRLHKPEQVETVEYNDSGVVYTGPVQSEFVVDEKPTLDQLLQDWRNADDFAKRKQAEADEAAAMRDEWWGMVQVKAGEMGVVLAQADSEIEPAKPAMTGEFRNAKIGSPKHYLSDKGWSDEICDECGKRFGVHFDTDCNPQ